MAIHPLRVLVTVRVNVPPIVAVGCATIVEVNPVDGLQEYDLFNTDAAPIVVIGVVQLIVLSVPASAVGAALSDVTVT